MPVSDDYDLDFKSVNSSVVYEILCDNHEFSRERVEKTLGKLGKSGKVLKNQRGLGEWMQ